jgi:hypothetical protein
VDPKIPFEAEVSQAISLAAPRGPRIADFNGDGASDVLLPLGGVFHIFENLASDQDVLIAVSDGMNEHDPADPEFAPNVSVSYSHLIDTSITSGAAPGDPALESALYLSRADPSNPCDYPRRCAVGPRRVVSGYTVNDGSGGVRRSSVRYEDGRYDRHGPSFVYFAKRTITDLDTLAGTADVYDNVTFDEDLKAYPFAGQVKRRWHWNHPNPHHHRFDPKTGARTRGRFTQTALGTSPLRWSREQGSLVAGAAAAGGVAGAAPTGGASLLNHSSLRRQRLGASALLPVTTFRGRGVSEKRLRSW